MIHVIFACGHRGSVKDDVASAPICTICGETRVQAVKTRPPRFVGVCRGPYAETKALEPGVWPCAPAGSLSLKEPT